MHGLHSGFRIRKRYKVRFIIHAKLVREMFLVHFRCRVISPPFPGDCLRQRAISVPGQQLICLPHKLWVEVVEQGAPDGELDVTAVTSADEVDLVSR